MNRIFSATWSLAFSTDDSLEVKLNNKVTTLPFLSKEWRLSFSLRSVDLSDRGGHVNILHMTTGDNDCCYGSRIPVIFFWPPEGLLIKSAISGENQQGALFASPTIGYTNIEIIQEIKECKMMFRVVINDVEVHKVENTDPRVFENVAVYAGDPWHMAYGGYIENLSIFVKN